MCVATEECCGLNGHKKHRREKMCLKHAGKKKLAEHTRRDPRSVNSLMEDTVEGTKSLGIIKGMRCMI